MLWNSRAVVAVKYSYSIQIEKQYCLTLIMKNYAAVIHKFRFIFIIFTLLLTVLLANGAKLLFSNPDNDYRTFFNDDNPELIAFDFIQNNFTKSDSALIVISPKKGDVFNPNSLAAVQWLTEQAWQLTHLSLIHIWRCRRRG